MSSEKALIDWKAICRRWIYMIVAIVAAVVLTYRPVFNFQEDKGIIYVRSFVMDSRTVSVVQTELASGIPQVVATVSVKGLYYCNMAMIWGSVLCLLCFFNKRWRTVIALLTAIIAGFYYVLMVFYAMRIADQQFATLYPNFMAIFPAIVCQMMILTRQNIIRSISEEEANEEEETNEE